MISMNICEVLRLGEILVGPGPDLPTDIYKWSWARELHMTIFIIFSNIPVLDMNGTIKIFWLDDTAWS